MTEEQDSRRLARIRTRAVDLDGRPFMLEAARKLRRRLPGDASFGDPLSTAGDHPSSMVGRQVSAFTPDRPSALRELGMGALQVWQSMSEKSGRGRGDEPLTLLFTDLVGFSSWALGVGDDAAVELLREVGVVVEGAVADHEGVIVKRLGDGVMATFADPEAAVRAALEAQRGLEDVAVEGHRPRMRAGVHAGRPRRIGGDYLGVDVNVAARVGAAARAGEVLVTSETCEQLPAEAFEVGRGKKLKAEGVPKGLQVRAVVAT
jgi:adenylate cyclase